MRYPSGDEVRISDLVVALRPGHGAIRGVVMAADAMSKSLHVAVTEVLQREPWPDGRWGNMAPGIVVAHGADGGTTYGRLDLEWVRLTHCELLCRHDGTRPTPVEANNRSTKRKMVCLCGSTRFKQEFIEANFRETMAGNIVLSVGWFSHADREKYTPTPAEKEAVDLLHLDKVAMADEVVVIAPGGYIGESTRREIEHAQKLDKPIRYTGAQATETIEANGQPVPAGVGQ